MRHARATLALLAAITAASAAAAASEATDEKGAAPVPVRIGLALPHEGPYQALGESVERGWRVALEEVGGRVAGRAIEVVSIDTKGDPAKAGVVAEALVRAGKVDLLAGAINSGVAVALARIATENKLPLVIAVAIADAITGQNCSPYVARTSFGAHAFYFAVGRHFARTQATAATMGPDHPAVGPILDAFREGFEAGGGKVVRDVRTPIDKATPWNQVIAGVRTSHAAMIFAFYAGPTAVDLVRAHAAAGLKDLQPLVGGPWLYGEGNWPAMGEAVLGAHQVVSHLRSLGNPENRRFVAAFRKRYKAEPDLYAYLGYENAKPIFAALAASEGETRDGAAFIATLTKGSYRLPRGVLRFNANRNAAVDNLYLAEIERSGGETRRRYVEVIEGADDPPGCGPGN